MQLFSELEIDYRATRNQVYKLFDRYRYLIDLLPLEVSPRLTQNLSFIPPSTKQSLNGIESVVNKRLEREKLEDELNTISNLISESIELLNAEEKIILVRRYLQKNTDTDYRIYTDMYLGKTKYYKMKRRAVNKMGTHLNLEVYKG